MKTPKKKYQAGMTLIEVTLVIAVLLGLISVLFIGVRAYKKGTDRAKCILNVSTVQKSVRSYQNLYELTDLTVPFDSNNIIGSGKMIETALVCPAGYGAYNYDPTDTAIGKAYATCNAPVEEEHFPKDVAGW